MITVGEGRTPAAVNNCFLGMIRHKKVVYLVCLRAVIGAVSGVCLVLEPCGRGGKVMGSKSP
eukprot:15007144-Ditylum_brightwellii.AAC.1